MAGSTGVGNGLKVSEMISVLQAAEEVSVDSLRATLQVWLETLSGARVGQDDLLDLFFLLSWSEVRLAMAKVDLPLNLSHLQRMVVVALKRGDELPIDRLRLAITRL